MLNNNDIVSIELLQSRGVRSDATSCETMESPLGQSLGFSCFKDNMDWIAFIKKHDLNKKKISELSKIDYSRFRNILNNGYQLKPTEIEPLNTAMKKYLEEMITDFIQKS